MVTKCAAVSKAIEEQEKKIRASLRLPRRDTLGGNLPLLPRQPISISR
jgi:hypothetical protein